MTPIKSASANSLLTVRLLLPVVALITVLSFYPLTAYFFAQDDFVLLNGAAGKSWSSFSSHFGGDPGQFRPLSKGLYFTLMFNIFDLKPGPYHVLSLLVHILNIVLLYRLLTELDIRPPSALIATSLFAFGSCFLHVIGWISCIQQLLALCFVLISLIWGIRTLKGPSRRNSAMSLSAYGLALMSMEQSFAVPVILLVYACSIQTDGRLGQRLARAARQLMPSFVLLVAYLAFRILWKGVPQTGPYAVTYGANLLTNLWTYLGWALDFGAMMPFRSAASTSAVTIPHIALALVIIFLVASRSFRPLLFGMSFFGLTIVPVLPLQHHLFYLHTYIPAFGLLYLVAVAIQRLVQPVLQRPHAAAAMVLTLIALAGAFSFVRVRQNLASTISDSVPLPTSFVLRRAVVAKNAWDDLARKETNRSGISRVHMIYRRGIESWSNDNVIAALGEGSAIKLFFNNPALTVEFHLASETLEIDNFDSTHERIYFYDSLGRCFTLAEYRERDRSRP